MVEAYISTASRITYFFLNLITVRSVFNYRYRAEHHGDQRAAGYYSMSLKFSDHDLESPFDLVLTTGRHRPYFNATTMDQFHAALKSGSEQMKQYLVSLPVW